MQKFALIGLLALAVALSSLHCGGNRSVGPEADAGVPTDAGGEGDTGGPVQITLIGGVQKGPLLLGSSVQVVMLDDRANPTGKVFNTTTINDLGDFQVVMNEAGYVELIGSGFYYNEIKGGLSTAPITLHALADVNLGTRQAYVNVITQMAQRRAKKLIAVGAVLEAAVAQAEGELRAALGIKHPDAANPGAGTTMNILGGDTADNEYLFGVSCILAHATGGDDAKLQEIINTIDVELEPAGTVSRTTGDKLTAAKGDVDPCVCISNLQQWLAQKGSALTVPDVKHVIDPAGWLDCATKCGGPANCGTVCPDNCVAPETCGGGGTPLACGCTRRCAGGCAGPDGCGGTCSDGPLCEHCGLLNEPCCDGDTCNDAGTECYGRACVTGDCAGKPDFTRCKLITSPDRKYDICIGGTCVSPGCGDTTCNTGGPHFPSPDTNERKCYNDPSEISCPTGIPAQCNQVSPEAFCGQDAQYGWGTLHQQAERFARTEVDFDQPIVADNVTGLIWQGCAAGLTGGTCDGGSAVTKTWSEALAYCDSLTWSGCGDWRLPDRYELLSIVDYGGPSPYIDMTAFSATPPDSFWSSSSGAGGTISAFYVDFRDGHVDYDDKTSTIYVRCVHGGQPVGGRFTRTEPIAGYPVVTDNITGLVWQGCAAGLSESTCKIGSLTEYTWQNALSYCESLNWSNYADWRLPNINELYSIVDDRQYDPAVDLTVFPATPSDSSSPSCFMSSSSADNGMSCRCVMFNYGLRNGGGKASTTSVRCVRGGQ